MDRSTAAIAEHFIGREHVPYLKTGNPIHAWRAYRVARALGVCQPTWVLDYFDRCADKVVDATDNAQIASALGLAQRKGGVSKPRQAKTNIRNFDIVSLFLSLKERPTSNDIRASAAKAPHAVRAALEPLLADVINVRENDTGLMQQVAEEYGLSAMTVRGIIYDLISSTRVQTAPSVELPEFLRNAVRP